MRIVIRATITQVTAKRLLKSLNAFFFIFQVYVHVVDILIWHPAGILLGLKSGHKTSVTYTSEYEICQSKKLLNLFSPLVRINSSGSFQLFSIQITGDQFLQISSRLKWPFMQSFTIVCTARQISSLAP